MARLMSFLLILQCVSFVYPKPKLQPRIVGGHDTALGEYPYMASLRAFVTNTGFCGGTIITNFHIVTAAHCTLGFYSDPSNIFVVVGAYDRRTDGRPFSVDRIKRHPEFKHKNLQHDIAIVKTSIPIQFSQMVHPIALPTLSLPFMGGLRSVAVGWGRTVSWVLIPFKNYFNI